MERPTDHTSAERAHPDSPRALELRDFAAFLAAIRTALPPGHAAFDSGLRVQLLLDVDATGAVTRAVADPATDPAVDAAVVAAVRSVAFHPAQRGGIAIAVTDHRVHMAVKAAALRPRADG
jgi:TonB family protein